MDGGLGFKDLESFNLALLAKQWWRLVQNERSLSHKVLKAKYFPYSTLHQAQKGSKASYLWASLLEGKRVVEQGANWRVGDGKSINVWNDRWIKKPPDFKVHKPDQVQPTPMHVERLFQNGKMEWNKEVIRELMGEEETSLVEKIPLSKNGMADRLIWKEYVLGAFLIKSAYYEARKVLNKGNWDKSNRDSL